MDHLKLQQAFDRYLDLTADSDKVVATYIFVDLQNNLCAKARTLDSEPKFPHGESGGLPEVTTMNEWMCNLAG